MSMKLNELLNERGATWDEMQALRDAAAKRSDEKFTPRETADSKRAEQRMGELSAEIDGLRGLAPSGGEVPSVGTAALAARRHGRDPRMLEQRDSMADYMRGRPGFHDGGDSSEEMNLGKIMRGMATGTWANADAEKRAMSEAVNSAGGYLVPVVTASRVIDLARNQARVIQAGAQTLVMESAVTIVPRQTADPAMTWHSENLQIVDTAPTFDAITFTAKTLPCLVIMSRELVQDTAVDLGPVVTNSIARALALEIDRAALRGSGTSPEPRGVRNTSGVAVTSLGANGANPTWDNISSSVALLRGLNFEPNAILDNARTEMRLAQLKDSNQRYLTPPVDVANLPRLTTNQVQVNLTQGTATTASEIYVGDWSKLWIGLRAEMTIQILHERFADFGQVAFLAWWRGDINVAHPQAFNILTGAL